MWTLLQTALTDAEGPEMLPFFAIASLSGVRPDEVTDLGTKTDGTKSDGWDDIYLDEDHPVIEVNKAKGGRSRRNADVCDPLKRILSWCKAKKLAANFFSKRKFDRIRQNAGVRQLWENDILRPGYASYSYALSKDEKTLSANMGNSPRVLFEHYIRTVRRAEAVAYFGLALHWSAPRQRSMTGGRIDKWLVKLPELPDDKLRLLHLRLAGVFARLCRKKVTDADAAEVRTNYQAVRAELRKRGLLKKRAVRMEWNRTVGADEPVFEKPHHELAELMDDAAGEN